MPKINSTDLPKCGWERFRFVTLPAIEANAKKSIEYIKLEFDQVALFNSCVQFMDSHFFFGFKRNSSISNMYGFFSEVADALENAIQQALFGYYINAYDNLRRALEMILASIYYSSEKVTDEEIVA
jgi:hypothetical protein